MSKHLRDALLVIVTTALGAGVIALAVYLGKHWEPREVLYDLGVALLVVGLLELFVLRILRELAARQSEIERLQEDLTKSYERHEEQMQAFNQSMRDIKVDNIFSTLHKVDELLNSKLDEISRTIVELRCRYPMVNSPQSLKE